MNCKRLFIAIFSLLFIVFNSCKNSNRNSNRNESKENDTATTETSTAPETSTTTGTSTATSSNPSSDSFLAVLRNSQMVYVGDFDTMLHRRIVRVLIPYSRTLFFIDKGKERGLSAENCREFETFLNKKYHQKSMPFTVALIPTPRDQLLPNLNKGLGDIAAGNLTATEERLKQVDFVAPKEQGSVSEIVITRKQDAPVTDVEQLSGKTVYVRKSSSYFESLEGLNKKLLEKGKPPVKLNIVSDNLEDEDLMEMVDAGIIPIIVVDDWKAKMWAQILPNIKLNDVSVRSGGYVGFAFRKNSPMLTAELNDFYYHYEKQLASMPYRMKSYYQNVKQLQDPTNSDNTKRYKEIMQLFEKYGREYGFDPMMLAAMGFQESKLNQDKRSPVGAVGVMQLMPKTGESMKVGNIMVTEANIHAGAKYMNILMTEYFGDAKFDQFNRSMFAIACYNAGPSRIAELRKLAVERGLNPDVWINNFENIVSEKVGIETTTYVRNIIKYYYSYKLIAERSEASEGERKSGVGSQ